MAFPFLQGFLKPISGLIRGPGPTLGYFMVGHENGFTSWLSCVQGWLVDYRQVQEFHRQDITGMHGYLGDPTTWANVVGACGVLAAEPWESRRLGHSAFQ